MWINECRLGFDLISKWNSCIKNIPIGVLFIFFKPEQEQQVSQNALLVDEWMPAGLQKPLRYIMVGVPEKLPTVRPPLSNPVIWE